MVRQGCLVLAVILLLLVGCGRESETAEPSTAPVPEEKTVPSLSPVAERTGVTILAEGVLQAGLPPLPLAFETGGKLLAVHVQAGDRIMPGDLIATLDDTNAQAELARAQLSLQQAELEKSDLQSRLGERMLSLERAELAMEQAKIEASQAITAAQTSLDKAWDDLEAANAAWANDTAEARGAVANAEVSLENARLNLTIVHKSDTVSKNVRDREYEANWHQVNYGEYLKKYERGEIDRTRLDLEYNNLLTAMERLDTARAQATLALGEAEARITQAEETLRLARARIAELQEKRAVTAAETALEQAVRAYQQAVENADPESPNMRLLALDAQRAGVSAKDLATAENNVAQARLALESAMRGLEKVELVAPAAGTAIAVEAVPGALVGAGSPIVTLLDTTKLEFHTTNMSERDLAQISPGQPAVVTLKAYPDRPIRATVIGIGLQAGAAVGDAATFPVILTLSVADLDLRPGMTGRAEIRSGD